MRAVAKKESELKSKSKILIENESFEIEDLISRVFKPRVIRRLTDRRILWVDDRPENNFYERKSLEALGIQFTISTSTEDALKILRTKKYDVIISDMGRPPDNRAGYTLLDEIKKMGINTPFIIYALDSHLPEHKAEARKKGAYESIESAAKLFEVVVSSIS